ncbi:LPXTG cell wall anchor domain-containing protein, partial [Candidatus Saccharibacteria bacterium]|nr:LPXTG cell wall anchor domain-containing protein [Candidatus Saccharibacteria bacterium]
LPTNVEYVPNSTYLRNTNYPNWVQLKDDDRTVVTTGINIGSYFADGDAYVRFTGKVVDKSLSCGKNQLVNWANVTVSSSSIKDAVYKDDASVITEKTCDVPNPDPDPDPTPKEFPNTGAGTIVTGVIGAGSMVTALGYYVASRKKLM